jgi:hypothetical protein
MANNSHDLLTLGDVVRVIARDHPDIRQHQVKYALSVSHIEPRQRAGILRLWGRDQLSDIRSAVERIAARGEGVRA